MIKIDKYRFGEVRYCDCMDGKYGLSSLKEKSFDIGFIDPPFNINLKNNINENQKMHNKRQVQYYEDLNPDYYDWCKIWIKQMRRICKIVFLYCGNLNLKMWYRISDPYDQIIYYMPYNKIITPTAWIGRFRPILIYTESKEMAQRKLNTNVIKKSNFNIPNWHPCPIDPNIIYIICSQLKAKSIIDPFFGSGTTGIIATKLGIPFIGYEIMELYRLKIDKRIQNCSIELKQSKLDEFIYYETKEIEV